MNEEQKTTKKKNFPTILLLFFFLIGLSLLLYPTVSDYWNSLRQTSAIVEYAEQVSNLDEETYNAILQSASLYNASLLHTENRFNMTDTQRDEYESQLSVEGTDVMGYIEITKIGAYLPIYHGTGVNALQSGVGHLEGSSLPVGGESTHCVISGHRGLPSADLFTKLDEMEIGDTFVIYVLDEVLTYEVDQIRIVLPDEMDELAIVEGEDYCTLLTCTPYGVNTHRLLVRGHRVDNAVETSAATADALQVEPVTVAPLIAVPLIILLLAGLLVTTRKRRR